MKVYMVPRFKLGDWVVYVDREGVCGNIPYMVVDYVPGVPIMILTRINPETGKPYEVQADVDRWRLP